MKAMLDFQCKPQQAPSNEEEGCTSEIPASLLEALSKLSNEELDKLEDELNFYAFTGIQGKLIQSVR